MPPKRGASIFSVTISSKANAGRAGRVSQKFRDTVRTKTRRTQGQSLAATIVDLNRTLKGWFGYFKHSHKFTFATLDRWVRMRLRSILRRRQGRQGRGRGADHQRWPNAYFAECGLFSLVMAHATACQPSRR